MRLSHCHTNGASVRSDLAPADFWRAQEYLREWRSGFNRYRRTWAGPEMTTGPGASWRQAEAAKRDTPSHDFFIFLITHVRGREDRICVPLSILY